MQLRAYIQACLIWPQIFHICRQITFLKTYIASYLEKCSVTLRDQDLASAKFHQVEKSEQYVRLRRKRMLLESCVLLPGPRSNNDCSNGEFSLSFSASITYFCLCIRYEHSLVSPSLWKTSSFLSPLLVKYLLLNMYVSCTKKFIRYMVQLSLSGLLSSGISYYTQKDCASKIYSAKKVYSGYSLANTHNRRRVKLLELAIYVCQQVILECIHFNFKS